MHNDIPPPDLEVTAINGVDIIQFWQQRLAMASDSTMVPYRLKGDPTGTAIRTAPAHYIRHCGHAFGFRKIYY